MSGPMTGSVVAIYSAAQAGAELVPLEVARLEAGHGLVGDRYFDRVGTFSKKLEPTRDWELTLIEKEEIDRFNAAAGVSLGPGRFRRNIVTTGVRLNDLVGRRFRVGEAVLEGIRLCEPCAHLGRLIGPAVVKGMVHRAGLRARIVSGASVRPGDLVA